MKAEVILVVPVIPEDAGKKSSYSTVAVTPVVPPTLASHDKAVIA